MTDRTKKISRLSWIAAEKITFPPQRYGQFDWQKDIAIMIYLLVTDPSTPN